jgi:hypothetical protein
MQANIDVYSFLNFHAIKTLTPVTELLNVVAKQWFKGTYTFCESRLYILNLQNQ